MPPMLTILLDWGVFLLIKPHSMCVHVWFLAAACYTYLQDNKSVHKIYDFYGWFGQTNFYRVIKRSTNQENSKAVPKEICTLIRASGAKMEFFPKFVEYHHFLEAHVATLKIDHSYTYTLQQAIEYACSQSLFSFLNYIQNKMFILNWWCMEDLFVTLIVILVPLTSLPLHSVPPSAFKKKNKMFSCFRPCPEDGVKILTGQLMKAVEHLTDHRLLHANLHPSNILLHLASYSIQLADFSGVINRPVDGCKRMDDPFAGDNKYFKKDFFSPERIIWNYLTANGENSCAVGAHVHYMSMGKVGIVS